MNEIYNQKPLYFEKNKKPKGSEATHCFLCYTHTVKNAEGVKRYYANAHKQIPTKEIFDKTENKYIKKPLSGDEFIKWASNVKYKDIDLTKGDRATTIGYINENVSFDDKLKK